MTKRVAAAVLCAVMNFMGSQDALAGGASDADEDGGGTDYVELRRDHDPASTDPLLATASAVVGGAEIDHAWIFHHHSGPNAAVAVQHDAADQTAVVSLSLDVPVLPWEAMLHRSLAFCRDADVLKVTIESEGLAFASVRPVAEASGFVFSRAKLVDGVHVAEFYTDLYHRTDRPHREA